MEPKQPIVTDDGVTRTIRYGEFTINIDTTSTRVANPLPGILFNFDDLLVKVIQIFDQPNTEHFRDALLEFRSNLATQPEIVKEFQRLFADSVVIDSEKYVFVEAEKWQEMVRFLNLASHSISPPALYLGDDDE
jgi:hypothetical protein